MWSIAVMGDGAVCRCVRRGDRVDWHSIAIQNRRNRASARDRASARASDRARAGGCVLNSNWLIGGRTITSIRIVQDNDVISNININSIINSINNSIDHIRRDRGRGVFHSSQSSSSGRNLSKVAHDSGHRGMRT